MTFPGYGPMDPRLPQAPKTHHVSPISQAPDQLPPATAKAAALSRRPYFIFFTPSPPEGDAKKAAL